MATEDGRLVVMFDLMPAQETPWHKVISVPAETAEPQGVIDLLSKWKDQKRYELLLGTPAGTFRRALGLYGEEAVRSMLQFKGRLHS